MERYLQFCRSNLDKLNQFKAVHLVVGNESCDLDSAVSAIVLAYVKYHQLTAATSDESVIALPVLNVPRHDLKLRRELVFWFEKVLDYDLSTLICRDEIDYAKLNSSSVHINLVDHNENREFARLLPQAVFDEIIDHHQPTYADGACQVIDPTRVHIDTGVGSCSSLVALRFLNCDLSSKFAETEAKDINFDSQIALLLYGPILLDTICFNHAAKRFNVKDYEAVSKLEDLLKHTSEAESSLFDRNDVYQRLVDAKNSLEGLTFKELLRMDMKMVESASDNNLAICISSMTGTLLTELSLKDKLNELKSFSENPPANAIFSHSRQRAFNAIVLMSLDNRIPNNLRRQLSLYCTNKHLMRSIATCLEKSDLELELITASESLRMYNQNNLTASRKAVLPIISTILNGPGSQSQRQISEEKRAEQGDTTDQPILSPPSAPSSLIQQPDSYYGSFIDDSFVGDFVGEYDHDEAGNYQPLRLDEESQNLVMMNPNDATGCMSHTHEIEFDFDSFGPESIIYPGNGQPATNNGLNGKQDNDKVNGDKTVPTLNGTKVVEEEDVDHKSLEDDSGFDKENVNLTAASFDDKSQSSSANRTTTTTPEHNAPEVKETVSIGEELTYCESGTSSMSDSNGRTNGGDEAEKDVPEAKQAEQLVNNQSQDEQVAKLDTTATEPMFSPVVASTPNNLSTFSRSSTLNRSQRRKILPQVNIKNLIITSDAFSPPPAADVNPGLLTKDEPSEATATNSATAASSANGHKEPEENFIVSSQQQNENNKSVMLDPLRALSDASSLNSSGLFRQPSLRKKVPVNYNMILHDQFEDSGKEEAAANKSEPTVQITSEENTGAENGSAVNAAAPDMSAPSLASVQLDSISALANGVIDMRVIEPFRGVISHGGFLHATANGQASEGASSSSSPAIIVFNACYLPDRSRVDYNYVMENLFMYVLTTLHNMIADDYVLIYLHNGGFVQKEGSGDEVTQANNMPTFTWLKRSYQMIDRKLKKNLKGLYLVHPTFWLKTLIIMSKPFISSKFSRKLKFVRNLDELKAMIPLEGITIPEPVRIFDRRFNQQAK